VGVPHAVEFVEDLDMVEVATLGREVRHDPAFAPAGTNMNFAEVRNGRLFVRTYERGVEAETKACGTGSVATCCVHAWREKLHGRQQFTINPTGGIPLEIGFTHTETGFYGVTLAGPALRRFEGHVDIDPEITRIGG
jgi:diaminopimelate epimerase